MFGSGLYVIPRKNMYAERNLEQSKEAISADTCDKGRRGHEPFKHKNR